MRKIALVLTVFVCASVFSAAGQNNPYGINDACFEYFEKAELLLGKEGFEDVNSKFLQSAITSGDNKAQTLYYVERFKHITRLELNNPINPAQEAKVLRAYDDLKHVASRLGYPQYYYYAYEILQNYYYNHGQAMRTIELVQELQKDAAERGEPYGLWMGTRYLVSLYIAQGDYVTAKKYILESIHMYETSADPLIRRQSVSRLYCDLSDTYVIGTDSVKININKAAACTKVHLDTLRVRYHLAIIAAYEHDLSAYRRYRDYCLADPMLPSISKTAGRLFATLDAIIDGTFDINTVNALSFSRIREVKYVANVAEMYGYKDQAFEIERLMVRKYEQLFSESNRSKIAELDARLGNTVLTTELEAKNRQMVRIYRMVSILLAVVLLVITLLLVLYIKGLRKHNRELEEANERVRNANDAKTRFIQNMSHEVRTPLNAIVGFSQLLSLPDGSFSPEEKDEFSGHIVNNTKMLTMLLDDILNASAMDSGNYRISYEQGEMHFMCKAAISSAEHRLQPGVKMYYSPESEEPFTFTTDPRRVQQILINLITNACKHTSKGEIKVTSSLTETPGFVTFAVTDTGPGIPAEQAEAIFDRFTKLNEFVQGTGLGLSICRDIAGRMGAKVFLDTTYTGGGARFVFTVPINPPEITIN